MPWKSTILSAATLHVRSSNAIVLDQVPSECSPPPRLTRLRPKAVNGYSFPSDLLFLALFSLRIAYCLKLTPYALVPACPVCSEVIARCGRGDSAARGRTGSVARESARNGCGLAGLRSDFAAIGSWNPTGFGSRGGVMGAASLLLGGANGVRSPRDADHLARSLVTPGAFGPARGGPLVGRHRPAFLARSMQPRTPDRRHGSVARNLGRGSGRVAVGRGGNGCRHSHRSAANRTGGSDSAENLRRPRGRTPRCTLGGEPRGANDFE